MHFEQGFEFQLVRLLGKCLAFALSEVCRDEQYGIGTHCLCLIELVLINDEVLAQDRAGDHRTGGAHISQGAAKVFLVRQDGNGTCTVLAVGSRNLFRLSLFLNPSFRRAFALELCNDARSAVGKALTHGASWRRIISQLSLHITI